MSQTETLLFDMFFHFVLFELASIDLDCFLHFSRKMFPNIDLKKFIVGIGFLHFAHQNAQTKDDERKTGKEKCRVGEIEINER